jgi:hypothetical protein
MRGAQEVIDLIKTSLKQPRTSDGTTNAGHDGKVGAYNNGYSDLSGPQKPRR